MAVHRQPVIHSAMPPVALPNSENAFTLFGKRLVPAADPSSVSSPIEKRVVQVSIPGKENVGSPLFPIDAEPRELDLERFAYRLPEAGSGTKDVWIAFATAPVIAEQPFGEAQPPAHRLSVPSEFVGQFGPKGNVGRIELQSDAAGEVVIEVFSQRLGEPTDPHITISRVLKDPKGNETLEQVAEADRGEERPAMPGYNITSEDPYVRLKVEKDAIYRIAVRDQNSSLRARQSYPYRLVVRRPQPDFRLLVSPASPWAADPKIPLRWPLSVRAGDAMAIPVVAVRHDGFANDIVVTAEGLPPGVRCDPVTIRAGKTAGQLVLTVDENAAGWVGSIRIVGESQVGETRVRKVATPASLVWDTTTANFDRARLNQQLRIAIIQELAPISVRFNETRWETTAGGVVKAKLSVAIRSEMKEALNLAPTGLPDGVTAKFTLADDKKSAELELTVDEKTPPGTYDFLIAGKPLALYRNNPEGAARGGEDQARIATLLEGFKTKREQLLAAAGAAADASSPEIKQLDDQIARGEVAVKEAADRAAKLAAAAQPAERRSYVVSNVGTLHVKEKLKE
jgi:hypothetical protein